MVFDGLPGQERGVGRVDIWCWRVFAGDLARWDVDVIEMEWSCGAGSYMDNSQWKLAMTDGRLMLVL